MLFKYCFLLHLINNYPSDTIKNLVIHHNYETRLKASDLKIYNNQGLCYFQLQNYLILIYMGAWSLGV